MFPPTLILASASLARAALMRMAGYHVRQIPSGAAEPRWRRGVAPFRTHLINLAARKAQVVARAHPKAFVISADTALLLDGRMIGKADNAVTAVRMLARLAGRPHRIVTAVYIVAPGGRHASGTASATVRMRAWPRKRIEEYVRRVRPFYCAGAYAVQERHGAGIVESIRGDITTVIGLPLDLVEKILSRLGYPSG